MSSRFFSLLFFTFFLLPFAQKTEHQLSGITRENAEAIIGFLASDVVEGREAGSTGGIIAAEYIISKLKEAGIEPLETTYLQPFEAVQRVAG